MKKALDAIEAGLIDLVTRVVPWLAPLPSAYMVYRNLATTFHLPTWLALAGAATVEGTGIMAIHTATRIRYYNLNKRKSDPESPAGAMAWLVAAYIGEVLAFTLASDAFPDLGNFAILFYIPLAAVSYAVNSVRMQHEAIERSVNTRSASGQGLVKKRAAVGQQNGQLAVSSRPETSRQAVNGQPEDGKSTGQNDVLTSVNRQRKLSKAEALDRLLEFLTENPDATYSQIGQAINRSKATAINYVNELQQAGRLAKNGHGWEVRYG